MGIILSDKFKHFLKYNSAKREFLEGTTYAGKTTVGIIKFMLKVAKSSKKQHIISGKDLGTLTKNIVTADLGITDIFGSLVEFNPDGKGKEPLSHILYHTPTGDKVVYLLGYDNVDKWKKALGGQYGCVYIDEINIADIMYVQEVFMRNDYLMATLNPDDPELEIYSQYINHSRPLLQYINDYPEELYNQLLSQQAKENWVHWFFTFDHNPSLTVEKRQQIIESVPIGTKQYKSKIEGRRAKMEGLVYHLFERSTHVIASLEESERVYAIYLGMDEGTITDDTTIVPVMATSHGRLITPKIFDYSPVEQGHTPLTHHDQAILIIDYLLCLAKEFNYFDNFGAMGSMVGWGESSAAGQELIMSINSLANEMGYPIQFASVGKKDIVADMMLVQGLIGVDGRWKIMNEPYVSPLTKREISKTSPLVRELETITWDKRKGKPTDGNDHCENALRYVCKGLIKIGLI